MAGRYNFTIKQGTDFSRTIIWNDTAGNPVDVTEYSARLTAKVRKDEAPVIEWTDADNITLGTTDGTITLSMSAAETRLLDFRYARYDLFLNNIHLQSGEITLERTTIDE